jgi:hypothetical protein
MPCHSNTSSRVSYTTCAPAPTHHFCAICKLNTQSLGHKTSSWSCSRSKLSTTTAESSKIRMSQLSLLNQQKPIHPKQSNIGKHHISQADELVGNSAANIWPTLSHFTCSCCSEEQSSRFEYFNGCKVSCA